jgi:hypothetical protein
MTYSAMTPLPDLPWRQHDLAEPAYRDLPPYLESMLMGASAIEQREARQFLRRFWAECEFKDLRPFLPESAGLPLNVWLAELIFAKAKDNLAIVQKRYVQ